MQPENRELIETVRLGGPDAGPALAQLVDRGVSVIPDVIHAIKSVDNWMERGDLGEILPHIHSPEAVAPLLEVATDPGVLGMSALIALGRTEDKKALIGLMKLLQDNSLPAYHVQYAVTALGSLGFEEAVLFLENLIEETVGGQVTDPNVIKQFIERAQQQKIIDEGTLILAIEAALAIAKLGSHRCYPLVAALARYQSEYATMGEDEWVRLRAIYALEIVTGPGIIDLLDTILKQEPSYEICESALWPLFYLGAKESVPVLIRQLSEARTPIISSVAVHLLRQLLGEDSFLQTQDVSGWWQNRKDDFENGVCYRLGQPLALAPIIHQLEVADSPVVLGRELNIITGIDFGFNDVLIWQDTNDLIENVKRWQKKNGAQYVPGQLYKYSFAQDLTTVTQPQSTEIDLNSPTG